MVGVPQDSRKKIKELSALYLEAALSSLCDAGWDSLHWYLAGDHLSPYSRIHVCKLHVVPAHQPLGDFPDEDDQRSALRC